MVKIFCPACKVFCGFSKADGTRPFSDDCLSPKPMTGGICPMLRELEQNAPPRRLGFDVGSGSASLTPRQASGSAKTR